MKREKFPRILTRIVASIGAILSLAIVVILLLADSKTISLLTDNVRYYSAKYVSEGVTLYETTLQRGELIGYSDTPEHSTDPNGKTYLFIGWDTTGDGVPDIIGDRIYSNFTANACYFALPFDEIDWSKVDWYQLLTLLEDMDIDLESFLNYFGISLEDLEDMNVPVIYYKTSLASGNAVYLRNQSYGDYDAKNSKWKDADYYSTKNISEGSVNPLEYTADKIKNCTYYGDLINTFDITYLKSGKKYHVPCYEVDNTQGINSDSYSLAKPTGKDEDGNGTYSTKGNSYVPAVPMTIAALKSIDYSNDAIKEDELKYREYVKEHYLYVQDEYKEYFTKLSEDNGISYIANGWSIIEQIDDYFADNGFQYKYDMGSIPKNEDPVLYFMNTLHEGIGRHFATATTLWYRTLGIPARYVQGAIDATEDTEIQEIDLAQTLHAWVEIYIDGVGWMTADSAIKCVYGDQYDFLFGGAAYDSDPFAEKQLVKVETEENVIDWIVGDAFTTNDIELIATYDDDSTKKVHPTTLTPINVDTSYEHQQMVVATYIEGSVSKSCAFILNIVRPRLESIELNTDNVKTKFELGSTFDYKNLVVTAKYNIGVDKILSDGDYEISYDPDITKTLGEKEITVSYSEYYEETDETISKEASYTIEVVEPKSIVPVSISITDYPKELESSVTIEETKKYVKFEVTFSDGSVKNQNQITSWDLSCANEEVYTNYTERYLIVKYSLNDSEVSDYFITDYVDYSSYTPTIKDAVYSKIYDGQGYDLTLSVSGIFDKYDNAYVSISKIRGTYAINKLTDAIKVGSWKFLATTIITNYKGEDITDLYTQFTDKEKTMAISIKQRPITLESYTFTDVYYPESGTPEFGVNYFANFNISGYGLVSGDYIADATFTYTIDGAGQYTNSFDVKSVVIKNANGEDVTNCYDITPIEGTITVNS